MDTDSNDIAANGFGNCLTRDGQGQPTANLPMANFRHTGVGNAVNRTDYAALGQAQDGLLEWTIATGTADAITATYTPSRGAPADGALYALRAIAANATTAPTFAPDSQTARIITKLGGASLAPGDIAGNLAEVIFRYNAANTRFELLNPVNTGLITTGRVMLTIETSAPAGWLLFDDGTFGSATSGSSNSNSAANQTLFTLMFNNVSDTNAALFTSTGAATTRAGQGTAAAAWAANCRMSLPKTLGRALGVAGAGSGLTSRALAQAAGSETNALSSVNQLPQFTPSGSIVSTASQNGGANNVNGFLNGGNNVGVGGTATGGQSINALPTITSTFTGNAIGSASPSSFSIIQPTTFLNAIIKQ